QMYGGAIAWPMRDARRLLAFHAELIEAAPGELFVDAVLTDLPDLGPAVLFSVCYSGPPARAEDWLEPLRPPGQTLIDEWRPVYCVALRWMKDGGQAPGRGHYDRSDFLASLPPQLGEAAVATLEEPHPPGTRIIPSGGCGGEFSR